MSEQKMERAPAGLGARGRRLWRTVAGGFDMSPDAREVLVEACRTLDLVERLESALAAEPVVTVGSTGQTRPHPLLAEVRQQRLTAGRLLAQLGIAAGLDDDHMTASQRARKAARARWDGTP